jgi:metal-responsive CopG/Arc/MetJ family transcriptional regulator
MKTIQVVLDESLLAHADREVRRRRVSRSELIREALRDHLRRERFKELEQRDRAGYEENPPIEFDVWDKVLAWPQG